MIAALYNIAMRAIASSRFQLKALSDRMTISISSAGIDTSLLKYYVKLREHRCSVTEGIRVVVFRNMTHLSRVMVQLGVKSTADRASRLSVIDQMLEDQGLEQSPTNRWLLDSATWVPLEVYMCLLYAEIENYWMISQKHALLAYQPLDDYLVSHRSMVQSLKDVRDGLLHPLKEAGYEHSLQTFVQCAKNVAPSYLTPIAEIQRLIDDYLQWLRESLKESVIEEAVALSNEQHLEGIRKNVEGLTALMEGSVDDEEKKSIGLSLKRELELRDFLVQNFAPGPALTAKQRQQLAQWETKQDALVWPLPNRPYDSSADFIQTPIHRKLSSFLPSPYEDEEPKWTGLDLPGFLRHKRSACIGLLFRSLIILNETYTGTVAAMDSKVPGRSLSDIVDGYGSLEKFVQEAMPIETVEDLRQAEVGTAPGVVALALIAEPLRLYRQITSTRNELRRDGIERLMGKDTLEPVSRFRNVVFHVPDDRTEASRAESEVFVRSSLLDDYRAFIGDLFAFYLRDRNKR